MEKYICLVDLNNIVTDIAGYSEPNLIKWNEIKGDKTVQTFELDIIPNGPKMWYGSNIVINEEEVNRIQQEIDLKAKIAAKVELDACNAMISDESISAEDKALLQAKIDSIQTIKPTPVQEIKQ
jgi:hypothetical protein